MGWSLCICILWALLWIFTDVGLTISLWLFYPPTSHVFTFWHYDYCHSPLDFLAISAGRSICAVLLCIPSIRAFIPAWMVDIATWTIALVTVVKLLFMAEDSTQLSYPGVWGDFFWSLLGLILLRMAYGYAKSKEKGKMRGAKLTQPTTQVLSSNEAPPADSNTNYAYTLSEQINSGNAIPRARYGRIRNGNTDVNVWKKANYDSLCHARIWTGPDGVASKLLKYAWKGNGWKWFSGLLVIGINAFCEIILVEALFPRYIGMVVNDIICEKPMGTFVWDLLKVAGIAMVVAVSSGLHTWALPTIVEQVGKKMRRELFATILHVLFGFFESRPVTNDKQGKDRMEGCENEYANEAALEDIEGSSASPNEVERGDDNDEDKNDPSTRLTSECTAAISAMEQCTAHLIRNFLILIFSGVILGLLNWRLALGALSVAMWGTKLIALLPDIDSDEKAVAKKISNLNGIANQAIAEAHQERKYNDKLEEIYHKGENIRRVRGIYTGCNEVLVGGILVGLLFYGRHLVIARMMPREDVIVFLLYFKALLAESFRWFTHGLNALRKGVGQTRMIFAYKEGLNRFDENVTHVGPTQPTSEEGRRGRIATAETNAELCPFAKDRNGSTKPTTPLLAFQHVYFTYPDGHGGRVEDVNFIIRPGEMVAMVGRSGSGKSTIIKLAVEFYSPTKGEILFNGRPISSTPRREKFGNRAARRTPIKAHTQFAKISLVSQEPAPFAGTIKSNIRFNMDAKCLEDQTLKAYYGAALYDLDEKKGLDTECGAGGRGLSGGQRQRVAIARALYRCSSLYILDEATSALDAFAEATIMKTLRELQENDKIGILVSAHRLSTVKDASEILVLDRGKVVERGTHKQLWGNKNGIYRKMWDEQNGTLGN